MLQRWKMPSYMSMSGSQHFDPWLPSQEKFKKHINQTSGATSSCRRPLRPWGWYLPDHGMFNTRVYKLLKEDKTITGRGLCGLRFKICPISSHQSRNGFSLRSVSFKCAPFLSSRNGDDERTELNWVTPISIRSVIQSYGYYVLFPSSPPPPQHCYPEQKEEAEGVKQISPRPRFSKCRAG